MSNWNKAQTLLFIELYEQYPELYDLKNPEYRNKTRREKRLREIADKMHEIRPDTTVNELKNKVKTLRSQYFRENTNILNSKKSGAGSDEVYVPKLWCFDQLKFLDSVGYDVGMESNIPALEITNEDITLSSDPDASSSISGVQKSVQSKKRKCDSFESSCIKSLEAANQLVEDVRLRRCQGESREANLGKIVEMETKGLDDSLFFETKWEIMEIIHKAQMKQRQEEENKKQRVQQTSCVCSQGRAPTSDSGAVTGNMDFQISTPEKSTTPELHQFFDDIRPRTLSSSSSSSSLPVFGAQSPVSIPIFRSPTPTKFAIFRPVGQPVRRQLCIGTGDDKKPKVLRVEVLKKPYNFCAQPQPSTSSQPGIVLSDEALAPQHEIDNDKDTLQIAMDSVLDDDDLF